MMYCTCKRAWHCSTGTFDSSATWRLKYGMVGSDHILLIFNFNFIPFYVKPVDIYPIITFVTDNSKMFHHYHSFFVESCKKKGCMHFKWISSSYANSRLKSYMLNHLTKMGNHTGNYINNPDTLCEWRNNNLTLGVCILDRFCLIYVNLRQSFSIKRWSTEFEIHAHSCGHTNLNL